MEQREFGTTTATVDFTERGTLGLDVMAGLINEAYNSELAWPSCQPLYSRIWRSDPEVTIARQVFDAFASQLTIGWTLPDVIQNGKLLKPNDADKRALDFAYTTLEDLDGGIKTWLRSALTRVPFYGWGWWEVLPGKRKAGWSPPGDDDWESEYDDGLIGYRRFAFRRYSSFYDWDISETNGRLYGMRQFDLPNKMVTIPIERSMHLKVGDSDNPEGLAALEAIWRLERLKYGLEVVQGIGFEHSAGYLNVEAERELTSEDIDIIRKAARAVLTAQEGNYAAWPRGVRGTLEDVPFTASNAILDAIRYYGILKLSMLLMQWVSMATLANTGSYSAVQDSSLMALKVFNAVATGLVDQADKQVGKRLFKYNVNDQAFAGRTRRPILTVTRIAKDTNLEELGKFITAFAAVFPLGEEDAISLRRASDIMPDVLPTGNFISEPQPAVPNTPPAPGDKQQNNSTKNENDSAADDNSDSSNLAVRTLGVGGDEYPVNVEYEAEITPADRLRADRRALRWADENSPTLAALLRAKPAEAENA